MIAVIHKNGTSFKGLMNYLLTGKDGQDPDRVAWTHTHNLAVEDPRQATAVMIGTAKSQDQLKREGGVAIRKNSPQVVQHISLSWDRDEKVDRDEMLAAALGSLSYLGNTEGEKISKTQVAKRTQFADEHQVVIVAHKDTDKEHCHLVINRVNPGHGALLPENKNFDKLSAWALDYRRAMGREDLCPRRAINAAKRAQGLLTSHPRKPRNVYEREQEKQAADPASRKRAILEQLERRGKELKARTERLKEQRTAKMAELKRAFVQGEREKRAEAAAHIRKAKSRVKTDHAKKIETLHARQNQERETFEAAKDTLAGRARNAWSALKTKAWMTEIRTSPLRATSQAFKLAFDAGMQKAQLDRYHAQEQRKLTAEGRKEEHAVAKAERGKLAEKLDEQRKRYVRDRSDLVLDAAMSQAKLKAEWKQLDHDRRVVRSEDGRPHEIEQGRQVGSGSKQGGGQGRMPVRQQAHPVVQPASKPEPYDPELIKKIAEEARQAQRQERQQDRDRGDRGVER